MHHFKRAPIAVIYESFPAGLVSKNYSNYFLIIFFFYSSAVVVVFSPLFFFFIKETIWTHLVSLVIPLLWSIVGDQDSLSNIEARGKNHFGWKKKWRKKWEREKKKHRFQWKKKGEKMEPWAAECQQMGFKVSKLLKGIWNKKTRTNTFSLLSPNLEMFSSVYTRFLPESLKFWKCSFSPSTPARIFFCVWLFRYWFIDLECECLSIGPAHQLQRLESPRLFWIRHRVSCSGLVNEFDYQIGERCGDEFRNRRCLVWPL